MIAALPRAAATDAIINVSQSRSKAEAFTGRRALRIFLLAVLLLLPCAAAQAGQVPPFRAECKLERQASLPFTIAHGHIDVPVTINGQAFTFLIDTGGVYSSITPRAAQALNLTEYDIRHDLMFSDVGGGMIRKYVRPDAIAFGRLLSPHPQLMVTNVGAEDGLIGPELLRNFDLEFDFDAHQLNLFKHHRCDDQVVYWTDDYAMVPFTVTGQGHIRLSVRVNDIPLTALMDTGAPRSAIGVATAMDKLSLAPPDSFDRTIAGGSGGRLGSAAGKFDSLQIGRFRWPDPAILISSQEGIWRKDDCDLLLGLHELSGLHLYIDYRGRTLYISRRTPPAAAAQ